MHEETVDGDLAVAGGDCIVISSTIRGDVRITDTNYLVMLNNEVRGRILVTRSDGNEGAGVANFIANTVIDGNFAVSDYAVANVIDNETRTGSIRVSRNGEALVQKNIAAHSLLCRDNDELSSYVNFARETLNCE